MKLLSMVDKLLEKAYLKAMVSQFLLETTPLLTSSLPSKSKQKSD